MTFEPLQWLLAALGAFMVGVSKSGITGLSILSVALFTHIFPSSKQASGIVLPLLIFGDFVAVFSYRRHTQWRYIWRLFPFTAAGVVIGYFTLGSVSDRHARVMIGAIIVSLAALSYWRRYGSAQSDVAASHRSWVFAASVGVVAGFITWLRMPPGLWMAIYFVSMRLPKLEYVGTAAVFFCASISSGSLHGRSRIDQPFTASGSHAACARGGARCLRGPLARDSYQPGAVRAARPGIERDRRPPAAAVIRKAFAMMAFKRVR